MRDPQLYINYTAQQFAEDPWFQQWVLDTDSEQAQFWSSWLETYPDQEEVVLLGRELVLQQSYYNNGVRPLSSAEKETIRETIYRRLDLTGFTDRTDGKKTDRENTNGKNAYRENTNRAGTDRVDNILNEMDDDVAVPDKADGQAPVKRLPWQAMTAAAVILLVVSSWLLMRIGKGKFNGSSTLLAERTGPNEIKKILLPDSSLVILNAGSVLEYSPDLSVRDHREVRLEGNAFFSVKKDAAYRAFVVRARTLSITVLGTELNVNARSAAAEVGLISGKVKVTHAGAEQDPVYLLPGDKISLDPLHQVFVRSAIDPELYSAWTDDKWNFRHTSMDKIAGLIREYYGVEVLFRNEKSRRLRINAVIAVGSLQKLIPVLEQTLHIQMFLSESRLIID